MREVVSVGSGTLEELREGLLLWDELCAQLRELYYRYLDLAAFRSEKCYFPGRKCVRSWERKYDVGDLTLMWTYILNTAPLCGKLMRALAEVEYKIRLRALESFEKYGGVERRSKPRNYREIVQIRLNRPIHAYLALVDETLYVIWGEFKNLPREVNRRVAAIEQRILDVIERYKRGEMVDMQIEEHSIDKEYKRLWLEVPLPSNAVNLFGGKDRAPIALFRNLGWLLSDDSRNRLEHRTGNLGQMAVRIFDWIATKVANSEPLIFKLSISYVAKTKKGVSPSILIRPIGKTSLLIQDFYRQFGIKLGKPEDVLNHGYTLLKTLREEAFKYEGRALVVNDVGAWIAFSVATSTLALGDGYISPIHVAVISKFSVEAAKALGGVVGKIPGGAIIYLKGWRVRLLLPTPPSPIFKRDLKLYSVLTNYPAAAVVEIGGTRYMLTYNDNTYFQIGKRKAIELYKSLERFGIKMKDVKRVFVLTYSQLKRLSQYVTVRMLNDLEKDLMKEVRAVPSFDLAILTSALKEVAKIAMITVGRFRGREYIRITPYDKSMLERVATLLKTARLRFSVNRTNQYIVIFERKSVEAVLKILSLFSTTALPYCRLIAHT